MDRRTLIFIIGITAIFFLLRQWFDFGVSPTPPAPTQSEIQVEISGKGGSSLLSKTDLQRLGISPLYADIGLKEPITFAVVSGDTYLCISPNDSLPKQAYTPVLVEGAPSVKRLSLTVAPAGVGEPALYSVYPLSKIEAGWIPEKGTYPVQLLYADQGKVYAISGQVEERKRLLIDQEPHKNCIVLLDYQNDVHPCGVYFYQTTKFTPIDAIPHFANQSVETFPEDSTLTQALKKQQHYVLENPYLQVVFSNVGGAITEINLPFKSATNTKSVVRPIEFDQIIASDYPDSASFPQFPSLSYGKGENGTVNVPVSKGGYYPLLRRSILGGAGDATARINPLYYALNVFQEDRDLELSLYTLKRIEKNLIEFEFTEGNRRILKTFTLPEDPEKAPYCIDLAVKVEGDARNLLLGLGIPEVELISGSFNPTLKYRITRNQKAKIEEIKPPKEILSFSHISPSWYCNGNGFFGIILDPLTKSTPGLTVYPIPGNLAPSRISVIDAQFDRYPPNKYPGYAMQVPIPSKPGVSRYRIFAGPFDKGILDRVDTTFANKVTGYNPDYVGAQSYHGWFAFISQPFAKFLSMLMNLFYVVTHSWGISIILLTIALRIMLYPLNNWSMKSMAKLQLVNPKVQAIQEKYKKEPKRAQQEIMELYRKEKANPFGGCLPMLIQLPFLFGMFDLLKSSFSLRGAPFIPGWINNLTAPDVLFSWSYPIPFIGTSFHLLPFLLGGIMFVQQKYLSPQKGTGATEQQKQQKSMGNIMTLVFTVLFYHFPSGLNIYWISSTLLGVLQQWMTNRKVLSSTKPALPNKR